MSQSGEGIQQQVVKSRKVNFNQLLSIIEVTGERVKVQQIRILSGPLPVLMKSSDNPQHHVYETLGQNLKLKLTST